jgi:hypothetical protein
MRRVSANTLKYPNGLSSNVQGAQNPAKPACTGFSFCGTISLYQDFSDISKS